MNERIVLFYHFDTDKKHEQSMLAISLRGNMVI